jgi:hypothetical protein
LWMLHKRKEPGNEVAYNVELLIPIVSMQHTDKLIQQSIVYLTMFSTCMQFRVHCVITCMNKPFIN